MLKDIQFVLSLHMCTTIRTTHLAACSAKISSGACRNATAACEYECNPNLLWD